MKNRHTLCKLCLIIIPFTLSSCVMTSYLILGIESYCPWNPLIDTKFSDSFKIKNLNKIEIGMSKEEVAALIGEPLWKYPKKKDGSELYRYTSDGAALIGDWAWYEVVILFNEDAVIDIQAEWVHD